MAAVTSVVVAGVGLAMTAYGQAAQGNAAQISANYNSMINERNARLSREKAAEDEKQFRVSVRKQQGSNVARLGASGVNLEGSPLEVLRENARNAEHDAMAIRFAGEQEREKYLTEARFNRTSGQSAARAANLGATAQVLYGAGDVLSRYEKL